MCQNGSSSRWPLAGLSAILALGLLAIQPDQSQAVNLARYNKLAKEEFLQLDSDVSQFYKEDYHQLDERNVSYEAQLYRSIRSIRHTTVLNLFDYMYTDKDVMQRSVGSRVQQDKCLRQLNELVKLAELATDPLESHRKVSLSALNFLESSGRTEPGILNGNFIWWGADASCLRARIPDHQLSPEAAAEGDIVGRHCIAHLKARSWPKDDPYFENRISIKLGLCLPDSCHSITYFNSSQVQQLVDSLAKLYLTAPYNSERFLIDYLYCLPDEESPLRQLDTGTYIFIAFVCCWMTMLAYCSLKYKKRQKTMQKLHNSVDIRMIINQKREAPGESSAVKSSKRQEKEPPKPPIEQPGECKTPTTTRKNEDNQKGLDIVKAMSITSNLEYLFSSRTGELNAKESQISQKRVNVDQVAGRTSQQVAGVNKRMSSSNEALIKDLQQDGTELKSKVSVEVNGDEQADQQVSPKGRVNIDILDGIKVIATTWIVYGHTLMLFFGMVIDLRFGNERMFDFVMISIINTLQVVGLFYIITGTLLTYLAFSRQKVRQLLRPSFWLLVVTGRYVRLLPVYLLVFWYARHVSPFTSSGMQWFDYRTDLENTRGFCGTQDFWNPLTMGAAYVKIPFDCVPQAWYLSNDFRTLLVLPVYIILLAWNRSAGYGAIFATFALSAVKLVSNLRAANVDFKVLLLWQPHVYSLLTDRLHDVYTDLAVRISTYLLGVIVGDLLYMYETHQIKQWPWWVEKFAMKFALVTASIFFMGAPLLSNPHINQFLPAPGDLDSDTLVMLIPLFKSAMEICICIVLLMLSSGGGYAWIRNLLSCRGAKVLSNISYAVFLVHIEIMYKTPAIKLVSNYYYIFLYSIYFIVVSNVIAFVLYVIYEMPINNLIRHLFKKVIKAMVG